MKRHILYLSDPENVQSNTFLILLSSMVRMSESVTNVNVNNSQDINHLVVAQQLKLTGHNI